MREVVVGAEVCLLLAAGVEAVSCELARRGRLVDTSAFAAAAVAELGPASLVLRPVSLELVDRAVGMVVLLCRGRRAPLYSAEGRRCRADDCRGCLLLPA